MSNARLVFSQNIVERAKPTSCIHQVNMDHHHTMRHHCKIRSHSILHLTSVKTLNLPHYLYKSMVKMVEKVRRMGENHHASLFHHGLVKVLVFHQLSQINFSWEGFVYSNSLLSSPAQSISHSTALTSPT